MHNVYVLKVLLLKKNCKKYRSDSPKGGIHDLEDIGISAMIILKGVLWK
jgi:hypothetical protein